MSTIKCLLVLVNESYVNKKKPLMLNLSVPKVTKNNIEQLKFNQLMPILIQFRANKVLLWKI